MFKWSTVVHVRDPAATFTLTFEAKEVLTDGRLLPVHPDTVLDAKWKGIASQRIDGRPLTGHEVVWGVWLEYTEFLTNCGLSAKVRCTEVTAEPVPGEVYQFTTRGFER